MQSIPRSRGMFDLSLLIPVGVRRAGAKASKELKLQNRKQCSCFTIAEAAQVYASCIKIPHHTLDARSQRRRRRAHPRTPVKRPACSKLNQSQQKQKTSKQKAKASLEKKARACADETRHIQPSEPETTGAPTTRNI